MGQPFSWLRSSFTSVGSSAGCSLAPTRDRVLDRRRRVIAFAFGEIFASVRGEANDDGTVMSRRVILRACDVGEFNGIPEDNHASH